MTAFFEIENDERYASYYDKGFIGLVEVMGDDTTICESARVSYRR